MLFVSKNAYHYNQNTHKLVLFNKYRLVDDKCGDILFIKPVIFKLYIINEIYILFSFSANQTINQSNQISLLHSDYTWYMVIHSIIT